MTWFAKAFLAESVAGSEVVMPASDAGRNSKQLKGTPETFGAGFTGGRQSRIRAASGDTIPPGSGDRLS